MAIMLHTITSDYDDPCRFIMIPATPEPGTENDAEALAAQQAERNKRELRIYDNALAATRQSALAGTLGAEVDRIQNFKEYLRICKWPKTEIDPRREALDSLERDWSAKMADEHLNTALRAAFDEDRALAMRHIAASKPFVSKAVMLGIGERFADIAARKTSVVEFTLSVKDTDDSRVKPPDLAPRPVNLAKSNRRTEQRYRAPALLAYLDGQVLMTEDYSMGGLGLVGYDGALEVGTEATMSFGRTKSELVTVEVNIRRKFKDSQFVGVQFTQAKPAVYTFIADLIRNFARRGGARVAG
jgi:hypothetical protein